MVDQLRCSECGGFWFVVMRIDGEKEYVCVRCGRCNKEKEDGR